MRSRGLSTNTTATTNLHSEVMVLVSTRFEVIVICGTTYNCRLDRVNTRLRARMEVNVFDNTGFASKCICYNQCPKASLVPNGNKMLSGIWGRYRKIDITSTHPTSPKTRQAKNQTVTHDSNRRKNKHHHYDHNRALHANTYHPLSGFSGEEDMTSRQCLGLAPWRPLSCNETPETKALGPTSTITHWGLLDCRFMGTVQAPRDGNSSPPRKPGAGVDGAENPANSFGVSSISTLCVTRLSTESCPAEQLYTRGNGLA